jgi:hypothetical protein
MMSIPLFCKKKLSRLRRKMISWEKWKSSMSLNATTTRIILHVKTRTPQSSATRVERRKIANKSGMKEINGIGGVELGARGRRNVGVILLLDGKEV